MALCEGGRTPPTPPLPMGVKFAPPCQGGEKKELQLLRSSPARKLKICLATLAPFIGGAEIAAERSSIGLQPRARA